ncbi:hypothetical protein [uncultured Akkermansia sp.]|uniref:hypothetical protein n=1 Tax=uncultured Akkermansia sp. TaxID=512294 RepID=UPI00265D0BB2|nr:hypothetical protein [uncultured Akkermansia sp.]
MKYAIATIGAAACCAMMSTTACLGNETAVEFSRPLSKDQLSAIPSKDRDWSFSLSSGWSSKYVTEGLDCLPGSGIWEVAPSVSWKNVTLSAWYAGGDSANYDELDLVLGYAWNLGNWTVNPWYEHQFYFTQDYNVANPALTVSYAVTGWLTVGAETQVKVEHQDFESYYSAFVQLEWSPVENVTVTPMVRYGYNGGYNVDYADGSNCIDWSLGVTWKWAECYSLSGSVNYSQAATVLRRENAGDEFWVGFRLGVEF